MIKVFEIFNFKNFKSKSYKLLKWRLRLVVFFVINKKMYVYKE